MVRSPDLAYVSANAIYWRSVARAFIIGHLGNAVLVPVTRDALSLSVSLSPQMHRIEHVETYRDSLVAYGGLLVASSHWVALQYAQRHRCAPMASRRPI